MPNAARTRTDPSVALRPGNQGSAGGRLPRDGAEATWRACNDREHAEEAGGAAASSSISADEMPPRHGPAQGQRLASLVRDVYGPQDRGSGPALVVGGFQRRRRSTLWMKPAQQDAPTGEGAPARRCSPVPPQFPPTVGESSSL